MDPVMTPLPPISLEQLLIMLRTLHENMGLLQDDEADIVLWAQAMIDIAKPISQAEAYQVQAIYNALTQRQFAG